MNVRDGQGTARIRALNDQLRQTGVGGRWMLSSGVAALPETARKTMVQAVTAFADFSPVNDPYGEHDCAVLAAAGHTILWKIDYYDTGLCFGSPDPADADQTCRILTLMLAEEY